MTKIIKNNDVLKLNSKCDDNKSVESKSSSSKKSNDDKSSSQEYLQNCLCKYGDKCNLKNNGCNRVHDIHDWKPKKCKFIQNCRYKEKCGYIHKNETNEHYLSRIINISTFKFYYQNRNLYIKHFDIKINNNE